MCFYSFGIYEFQILKGKFHRSLSKLQFLRLFVFCKLILLSASALAGLSSGLINDFQSGTVEGWSHAQVNPFAPYIAPDDGMNGVGDYALRIRSSGTNGAGSNLIAFINNPEWTGAAAAGITGLSMDLKHISSAQGDLNIRIAVRNSSGSTWLISNTAHVLDAQNSGNWEQAFFSFSDLVTSPGSGSDTLAQVLADIGEVRILHNSGNSGGVSFQGEHIAGEFAVDNISAVPLPAAAWLFIQGMGILGLYRKKFSL